MRYRVVTTYLMYLLLVPSLAQQLRARVVGGTAEAGRLEIFYDGTWNTVCGDGFGQKEALVACRMLGFNSTTAVAVGSNKYGEGSGPILFNNLQCVGNETSLAQCQHSGLYRHSCYHWQDVGVMCNTSNQTSQELTVRVVGGTAEAGRLEIFYDETWNTVCDYGFGQEEALVACRMLGFNSTTAVAVGSAKYGAGSGPILFSDLQCVGNETSLAQCQHSGLYLDYCEHWEDVGVMCNFTQQLKARVVGGTESAGSLEILFDGTWGTVCDNGFRMIEARVACRMLGFNDTKLTAVPSIKYRGGSGPILLDGVSCRGTETSLAQCDHKVFYHHDCDHSEDVGIICNIKVWETAQQLSARVVGGTPQAGRLEILYNGAWGTVCRDIFGQEEALVACRMLGFNSTAAAVDISGKYGRGSGKILFDELVCAGSETSLSQCQHRGFYTHDCDHSEDVGVVCDLDRWNSTQQMKARVVGGTEGNGRLEILYNGTWSTVCNNGFHNTEAQVACRMLGFNSTATPVLSSAMYGEGRGTILLDNLECQGTEKSLEQCRHRGYYNHDCNHTEDVGVICNMSSTQMEAHLVNGTSTSGRLELLINGQQGTVCNQVFGRKEAQVACRMLGFEGVEAAVVSPARYGKGSGHVILGYLECRGWETSLTQCSINSFYSNVCDHWDDVGVVCTTKSFIKGKPSVTFQWRLIVAEEKKLLVQGRQLVYVRGN
ncbi:deleted in malignant brain tumors 1 protein-like isoform X2 [Pomacea canaliculata]|uniref:deleted in malignant brain tumors 1 protein-like isoform X2 n=1 Tax=Pomacea canaliculata TaxID=400727 RepID=UPI000D72717D|nr:deleted in malignant brain tumors 1 protein-like isoform X2 [Pomacea canaliculata]